MEEESSVNIAEIARLNNKTREDGEKLTREMDGVVQIFNRVLQYKEKERGILEKNIVDFQTRIDEHVAKIRVLDTNLNIYDANNEKVTIGLSNLDHQEMAIKKKYEALLSGSLNLEDVEDLEAGKMTVQKRIAVDVEEKLISRYSETHAGRDNLMKRRREYLENLDNVFRRFDEDLFNIDGVRNNLLNARKEIEYKKEKALNSRFSLESNHEALMEEKLKYEEELIKSAREESYLLKEYRELIVPVTRHVEIRPQTDQVIFNLLGVVESEAETETDSGKTHLKVVQTPLKSASA